MASPALAALASRRSRFLLRARVSAPRVASEDIADRVARACRARVVVFEAPENTQKCTHFVSRSILVPTDVSSSARP